MISSKEAEIYRFKSKSGNDYVFDNVSGAIFPFSDMLYYIVCNFNTINKNQMVGDLVAKYDLSNNDSEIRYKYIADLISMDCFYRKDAKFTADKPTHQNILKTDFSQLLLTVTEDCNMRCKYCIYSSHYANTEGYSTKVMSFDIAKKSIDYYMKQHEDKVEKGFSKDPIISFYGGEPLLEFGLLENIVKYCKERKYFPSYNLTTNGTVMNEEIIDFLIDNKINVTFSLDGNKKQHDRNRVFQKGKETFDIVFKNICALQKAKKDNKQEVIFSCCYDSYTDLKEVIDFFDRQHDLFEPYHVIYNQVYKYDTSYYSCMNDFHKKQAEPIPKDTCKNSLKKLQTTFTCNAINGTKNSQALTSLFTGLILTNARGKGVCSGLCGTCSIGGKIAVSPSGKFYICEKMSQNCSIGDVDNGLDIEKIDYLQNKFLSIINKKCLHCSLSRLCNICYMHLGKKDDLEFNDSFCEDHKNSVPKMLDIVTSVLESNFNAFNNLAQPITTNKKE